MSFDYIIVGGGTAGSILASRISEDPSVSVCLVEWGPDDRGEERARLLKRWDEMVGSEYDIDYRYTPQQRGNSMIHQTRMRLLGGCSNTNTMIAWKPLKADLDEWSKLGADGWTSEALLPYYEKLLTPIYPVVEKDRHPMVKDAIKAASQALDIPIQEQWNDGRLESQSCGTGFFEVGYDPVTNQRGASSIDYLHPVLSRPNLELMTNTRCTKVNLTAAKPPRAIGIQLEGNKSLRAYREVILCSGAIDSPKLLQLSGIGPRNVLEAAGVTCHVDLVGVGENLQDHAEGLVVWESKRRVPKAPCASGWDGGCMFHINPLESSSGASALPDALCHFPVEPWTMHAEAIGYEFPADIISFTPNVAKPASRGKVWIISSNPDIPPKIDPRYFTDVGGHDERVLVEGIRACRKIATCEPFKSWIKQEVFPGASIQTFEDISRIARATHQTVYHMSCTCAMGSVLDPRLRVCGVSGLRVVDASSFPTLTSVNPVITIELLAERASDMIRSDRHDAKI